MSVRLPAEWEHQSAILLAWPHQNTDWNPILDSVISTYIEIARAVTKYQKLVICFHSAKLQDETLRLFDNLKLPKSNITSFIAENNDTWLRDSGPITIMNNDKPELLDFIFNAWGGKYSSELDNQITTRFCQSLLSKDIRRKHVDMVLEGGSIESDGKGTLLTTSKCLLTDTRNNSLTRKDIDENLTQLLGLKRILWLENGFMIGDDTDSHIDTLARFCPNDVIAYCTCKDKRDPHFDELAKMEQELKDLQTIDGKPYDLVELPIPKPIFANDKTRLPATYANFLILNNAVLLPIYGDNEADNFAKAQLKSIFPDREIIAINCRSLIEQFGSLHCVTMQLPKGVTLND